MEHRHRRGINDQWPLRARYAQGSLDVVVSDELPAAASAPEVKRAWR